MKAAIVRLIFAMSSIALKAKALEEHQGSIDEYLHASLTSYELLSPVRLVSRRAAEHGAETAKHLNFRAFNKQFNLILKPWIRDPRTLSVRIDVQSNDTQQTDRISAEDLFSDFYTGYLDDDPSSHASGYVSKGSVHLTIHRGNQDVLNIEPLSLMTGNQSEHRLLAYYDSSLNNSQSRCGMPDSPGNRSAPVEDRRRSRRSSASDSTSAPATQPSVAPVYACRLHMVVDHTFVGHTRSADVALKVVIKAVDDVNTIFLRSEFKSSDGLTFTGIGFELNRLTALSHPITSQLPQDSGHFNAAQRPDELLTASHLLRAFGNENQTKLNLQSSCLAHLVTYRRLTDRVLGLAYHGGLCAEPIQARAPSRADILARNIGLTTFRHKDGAAIPTRQATLVIAHELAHGLGALHDPTAGVCNPGPGRGGHYLMHEQSVMGDEPNHIHLSTCSRRAIGDVIKERLHHCFINASGQLCGNYRREPGEDCDAGPVGDTCCDRHCRLHPRANCSDANSPCCWNCALAPPGVVCGSGPPLWPCRGSTVCDGRTDVCPKVGDRLPDGVQCLQGAGVCKGGECRSHCQLAGLRDCRCQAPSESCQLCCEAKNGSCMVVRLAGASGGGNGDGTVRWSGCTRDSSAGAVPGGMTARLWRLTEQPHGGISMQNTMVVVTIFLSLLLWVPMCIVYDYRVSANDARPDRGNDQISRLAASDSHTHI